MPDTTRREVLKAGGLSLLVAGVGGPAAAALGRAATPVAARQGPVRRRTLVPIFLRGGMDGLAAVTPLAAAVRLAELRPSLMRRLAQRPTEYGFGDVERGFVLHPALRALAPVWRDGHLAVVHAVGLPVANGSHVEAQGWMEAGAYAGASSRSGWLNRAAGMLAPDATPLRAVALGGSLPRSLQGRCQVSALEDSAVIARVSAAPVAPPSARGPYPTSSLGQALQGIAALIKADVGVEIAAADSEGWDTHVEQGAEAGGLARRLRDLARSLRAFWNDLGERRDDVVVLTMTEFGRSVRENRTGGTEHGHGSCQFVLGSRIDGGRVYGTVPPLDAEAQGESDALPVTTDYRAVLSEVSARHLGIDNDSALFPGWRGSRLPLFRA